MNGHITQPKLQKGVADKRLSYKMQCPCQGGNIHSPDDDVSSVIGKVTAVSNAGDDPLSEVKGMAVVLTLMLSTAAEKINLYHDIKEPPINDTNTALIVVAPSPLKTPTPTHLAPVTLSHIHTVSRSVPVIRSVASKIPSQQEKKNSFPNKPQTCCMQCLIPGTKIIFLN